MSTFLNVVVLKDGFRRMAEFLCFSKMGTLRCVMDFNRRNPSDDYELLQRVGSGTYGAVYKARHIVSGEFAAVKVIKLEPGDDFSVIQQEIVMMKECKNPNIIAYYNSYLRRDKLWIVMEYCSGGSLQDIYHMTGPLQELQIAFVCRETLKGLQYLHSMGKIHRDIKGANILLTENGDVKLADFGVAAQITATISKRRSFIGTPYWMAPEVAAVERKGGYNQLCDVWAVGITAIELAELQPPLFDLHPMRVLVLMSKPNYKPPSLRDKIRWSPAFHEFVKQSLTKNPKKRPTPEKLLTYSSFLQGKLTNRLTRDLLDRVNNSGQASTSEEHNYELEDDEPGPSRAPKEIHSKRSSSVQPEAVNRIRPSVSTQNNCKPVPVIDSPFSVQETESISDILRRWGIVDRCSSDDRQANAARYVGRDRNKKVQIDEQQQQKQATTSDASSSSARYDQGQTLQVNGSGTPPDLETVQLQQGCCSSSGSDSESYLPPVPPDRRRSKEHRSRANVRQSAFGLPPTPKVVMGACFSKIFNQCPLNIQCAASWIHSETKEQHILIGASEGIYSLNLNELHEATLRRVCFRPCSWMYVYKDTLMAIQGKTTHLYRHSLISLHSANLTNRLSSLPLNRLPAKIFPRRLAISCRVANTKGCTRCCVALNPFHGHRFLAVAISTGILLMQWYEPLQKFLRIKLVECTMPSLIPVFEMFIPVEHQYPVVCCGVRAESSGKHVVFDYIDLNITETLFSKPHLSNLPLLDVSAVQQLQKDVVLIAHGDKVKLVNFKGKLKSSRYAPAEFEFPFKIERIVCLSDSVLAFHKFGMQGRSFIDSKITQDIEDKSQEYRVIGSDRLIVLESHRQADSTQSEHQNAVNLYILSGHESM
ncbi:Mitogen-activated protein kinase kinase kinase kinase 5 [Trichinella pseudospiralis]|uniref:Mitogen-activated protein kinase kinase kinase kinase n=1 Tax=Trichinella pseudospiralis TaxID=6337 RepID=A0A0V1E211_TRIPS|nr:Mitogen-activated protein kinase kinase kinase kinase 5 [Trichinella pseudospiralis]